MIQEYEFMTYEGTEYNMTFMKQRLESFSRFLMDRGIYDSFVNALNSESGRTLQNITQESSIESWPTYIDSFSWDSCSVGFGPMSEAHEVWSSLPRSKRALKKVLLYKAKGEIVNKFEFVS